MATIERRVSSDGKVSYRAKVRLRGYPAQSATFTRKTDAKKWVQDTESGLREGRYFPTVEARRKTLGDLVDRYTRDVTPTKKDGAKQARQLAWWRDELGAYLLKDVTPALVAESRDKLLAEPGPTGKQRGGATVNRYLAALSHAFTVAVREWGWLDENPLKRVTRRREPKGRVRYLSSDERDRLLAACRAEEGTDLYPAVVLALSTGMRRSEILGLRWGDVDTERGLVVLHETKNGERRGVPVAGHALETLREWAKVRRLNDDRVFPDGGTFDRRFRAAVRAASVADFRFHDLRHSAASYLAMGGASPSEIAGVLGHKTLAMVKRYAHLSDAHLHGVVEKMNERIFGGES